MADVYQVGVKLALSSNHAGVLGALSSSLLGVNTKIKDIEKGFAAWRTPLLGVAGLLGAIGITKGLHAIAAAGGKVNHELNMMKSAGMSVAEVQDSVAAAMKTSGSVMTTTLSENLRHVRELRYAFGETTTAIEHLDEISKSNSILNNVAGGGHDAVWSLVKALEGKGETFDPKAFSSYVNTMTKVVQATGGRVTPDDFMSAFKYGRTATLGWSEEFIGGALPRLIQSMQSRGGSGGSGGPGNALMSAFAKIVQGQMPKTAAEEFDRMGLAPGGVAHIKGSSNSQIPGGIAGRDLFMRDPYEWTQKILMPALAAKGITSQNDVIAQISKMFPVRTASQIITEMGLQGRFHEGSNSPFEKDIKLQRGATGLPAFDDLIKNDYPMVLKAFNQQFTNLLETLGNPMMAPGGPVIQAMAGVASAMGSLAQLAGKNSEAIGGFVHFVGRLVSAGVAVGGFIANMTGVAAVFDLFGKIPWGTIASGLDSVRAAIAKLIDWIGSIPSIIAPKLKGFNNPGNVPPIGDPMNFRMPRQNPSAIQARTTIPTVQISLDGRLLAEVLGSQLHSDHPIQAPSFDPMANYQGGDGQI